MSRLVILDTETTSLRPDRRAWDIALIVREPGKGDVEHQWFIDLSDLELGGADLASLRIGRFYDRHPQMRPESEREDDPFGATAGCYYEAYALAQVEELTRGAHLVGAVPNFDAETLAARMRAHGICPSWHYHLIDVEALAVGYLAGRWAQAQGHGGPVEPGPGRALPWRSDDLAQAVGVEGSDEGKHTAIGDARWARDIYDAVMGGQA